MALVDSGIQLPTGDWTLACELSEGWPFATVIARQKHAGASSDNDTGVFIWNSFNDAGSTVKLSGTNGGNINDSGAPKFITIRRVGTTCYTGVDGVENSGGTWPADDVLAAALNVNDSYIDVASVQLLDPGANAVRAAYAAWAGIDNLQSPLRRRIESDTGDAAETSMIVAVSGDSIAPDVIGGNFHGAHVNDPTIVRGTHPHGFEAVVYDGVAEYTDIGTGDDFGSSATTGFTVDVWVRSYDNTATRCIIGGDAGVSGGMLVYANTQSDGSTFGADCLYISAADSDGDILAGGINVATGLYDSTGASRSLRHLRMSFDFANQIVYAWIDGRPQTVTMSSTDTLTAYDFPVSLYVGARNNNGSASHYFDGIIGPVTLQPLKTPAVFAQRAFVVGRPVIQRCRFRQPARLARPQHLLGRR